MKYYKTTAYPDGVAFDEMTVNGDYFYIALEEPAEPPAGAVEITAEEFAAMVALEEIATVAEFVPTDETADVLAEILLGQIRLEEYANNQDDTNAAILLGQAEILANLT